MNPPHLALNNTKIMIKNRNLNKLYNLLKVNLSLKVLSLLNNDLFCNSSLDFLFALEV